MAAQIFAAVSASEPLTVHEALSGLFGSVSLATWVFLSVPQLVMNYQTGSADGLSIAFLFVWLIGDLTNLGGALWAQLVPMVIVLAAYFCIGDCALIGQYLYYNIVNAKRERQPSDASEDEPLLARSRTNDSAGLPGSHRRASLRRQSSSGISERRSSMSKIIEGDDESPTHTWIRNICSIFLVFVIGTVGWLISWKIGVWKPSVEESPGVNATEMAAGAQVLGYFSALCYLCARLPQIYKNYKERSCEGLSLLFFLLSLTGNLTYGLGILCHSLEKEYVLKNLPWLLGSLGTMIEDGVIFMQFRLYSGSSSSPFNGA